MFNTTYLVAFAQTLVERVGLNTLSGSGLGQAAPPRVRSIFILAGLMGLLGTAHAQKEAPVMPAEVDLQTAIRMAYEFNPTLNETRERLNEQAGSLTVTKSSRLPKFDAFGLYQWEQESRSGSFGGPVTPDEYQWRYGAQVAQPIYAGGILNSAVRSKRFQSEALEQDVIASQTRILTDVQNKFYNALLAREVIRVQEESLDLVKRQLNLAQNRFNAGAGPRFDVLQAEVRVANARPPLIRAENEFRRSIDDLRTSMGAVYGPSMSPSNITLKGVLPEETFDADIDKSISLALEKRPELMALVNLRESAREDVLKTSRQHAPQVDAFANYSVENDRFSAESNELDGWQAGVMASLAIWEGGRIRGQVAEAQSRLNQVMLQEESARLAIELEVRNAWNRVHEAKEILDASNLVITQAEEALRLAENRYSAGALTQLDVLTTQLEFTKAKLDKITAVRDYSVSVIDFQRAIGGQPGIQYITE
jgi:outer membrane protein